MFDYTVTFPHQVKITTETHVCNEATYGIFQITAIFALECEKTCSTVHPNKPVVIVIKINKVYVPKTYL